MPHNRNSSSSFHPPGQDAHHQGEQERLSDHDRHNTSHEPYHDSPLSPSFPPSSFPTQHSHAGNYPTPRLFHPSAHPDSNFERAQRARTDSVGSQRNSLPLASDSISYGQPPDSPSPPPAPPHRQSLTGHPTNNLWSDHHHHHSHNHDRILGQQQSARGGALFPAATDDSGQQDLQPGSMIGQEGFGLEDMGAEQRTAPPFSLMPSDANLPPRSTDAPGHLRNQGSDSSSTLPIAGGAATPGSATPIQPASEGSRHSLPLYDHQSRQLHGPYSPYQDSPYQNSSLHFVPQVGHTEINPHDIADDGDDGFIPEPKRKSVLGKTGSSRVNAGPTPATAAATGAGAGAAAGGIMGALASLVGRKQRGQTSDAAYDPVGPSGQVERGGAAGSARAEKSEWLSSQTNGNSRMRWLLGLLIGLLVILAVVGAVVGGVLGSRSAASESGSRPSGSSSNHNNADDDLAANGDLNKDSAEIRALMDNPDMHKVFPAMDYTPWGVQYPLCLTYPPSQNNITRDMAVLSQLSNVVRLYGTDCNQTEMVLHAIDRLGLSSMKLWLGVWIESNKTTNNRQLEKLYTILEDTSDHSIFKGAIIGNEALYRAEDSDKAESQRELIQTLESVRSNFTSLGYDMPVTTSDLGDNWNAELVSAVDVIMSNIHPFFAGVRVKEAAGWTWSFWKNKNTPLTKGNDIPQVISETGWPSGGGNDCGTVSTTCSDDTSGAVAGVDEMNIFMDDFVCQAMENGTDYFWFEAFDEPWKVVFNEPGQEWEDKWGLMDAGRNLKPGLKIPDCGGRTVD